MPSSAFAPRPLLALDFDPRPWAGVTVATHGGGRNITIPAAASRFLDILTALNGRGSYSLAQSIAFNATGAGVWTVGIDANDRVYIQCTGDDFTVGAGLEALGFAAGGHGLVGGGGPVYRRTSPSEWVRGPVRGVDATITPTASAAFSLVGAPQRTLVESVPIWCVQPGTDPYDDTDGVPGTYDLSFLHRIATGSASPHWSLDADGHVQIAWSTSIVASFAWASSSFRKALGFDGTETTDTSAGVVRLRANHPCPYAWVPSYAPVRMTHSRGREGTTTRLRSGEVVSSVRGRWQSMRLEVWAHGSASSRNEVAHVLRRFGSKLDVGARVTVYRERDETRYARTELEAAGDWSAYVTPQDDGRWGRRRYFVSEPPGVLEWADNLEYMALMGMGLDEEPV